ncbi:hypothetical protein PIB30_089742 [Stylosanthes scabra]|uniref:Uncharacterized protein n=1 Tax=Stylosanthes scabra TaxID=79078 RepID=A0ABU6UV72_9FABA|nr:hypothetical protein [Stylosanthes scabra]
MSNREGIKGYANQKNRQCEELARGTKKNRAYRSDSNVAAQRGAEMADDNEGPHSGRARLGRDRSSETAISAAKPAFTYLRNECTSSGAPFVGAFAIMIDVAEETCHDHVYGQIVSSVGDAAPETGS